MDDFDNFDNGSNQSTEEGDTGARNNEDGGSRRSALFVARNSGTIDQGESPTCRSIGFQLNRSLQGFTEDSGMEPKWRLGAARRVRCCGAKFVVIC